MVVLHDEDLSTVARTDVAAGGSFAVGVPLGRYVVVARPEPVAPFGTSGHVATVLPGPPVRLTMTERPVAGSLGECDVERFRVPLEPAGQPISNRPVLLANGRFAVAVRHIVRRVSAEDPLDVGSLKVDLIEAPDGPSLSVALTDCAGLGPDVAVASATDFPDGLAGGAHAAATDRPMFLVDETSASNSVACVSANLMFRPWLCTAAPRPFLPDSPLQVG